MENNSIPEDTTRHTILHDQKRESYDGLDGGRRRDANGTHTDTVEELRTNTKVHAVIPSEQGRTKHTRKRTKAI